ncbi:ArsR family transcriptional regulator [Candidatus Woesearchaeota archaeon]|nr:MAG: ArsR family transcriptional regulator [Candidatus Woesearchaeota archaeon]
MKENTSAGERLDKLKIIETLFDKKKIRILQTLLKHPEKDFYLRELSRMAGVPPATTFRIISLFEKTGLVQTIKVSRIKLYRASENENMRFLAGFLKEEPLVIDTFVEKASKVEGVERIIQHGKSEKNKANILIIGSGVDSEKIKQISAEILERYNFRISSLTLSQEQFEQMRSMGLYSGIKKTLYDALRSQK